MTKVSEAARRVFLSGTYEDQNDCIEEIKNNLAGQGITVLHFKEGDFYGGRNRGSSARSSALCTSAALGTRCSVTCACTLADSYWTALPGPASFARRYSVANSSRTCLSLPRLILAHIKT